MLRWAILALFAASASGCSTETASDLADGASALNSSARIFVAISSTPSQIDPTAYRLFAASPLTLDNTSLSFCFETVAACQANRGVREPGVARVISGQTIFVTQRFVRLSNLQFTIEARDSTGAMVYQPVMIQSRNGAFTPTPIPTQYPPIFPTLYPTTNPTAYPTAFQTLPPDNSTAQCYKAPSESICRAEVEVVRLTNAKRAQQGIPALRIEPRLGYVARLWADQMAQGGMEAVGHDWFPTRLQSEYQREFGTQGSFGAENVAAGPAGSTPEQSAAQLVDQWWNSDGHRRNMLDSSLTTLGVGISVSGGYVYGTQDFGRN